MSEYVRAVRTRRGGTGPRAITSTSNMLESDDENSDEEDSDPTSSLNDLTVTDPNSGVEDLVPVEPFPVRALPPAINEERASELKQVSWKSRKRENLVSGSVPLSARGKLTTYRRIFSQWQSW